MVTNALYDVVSPEGKHVVEDILPALPLVNLEMKKIAFIWTPSFTNGDILADAWLERLKDKFTNIETIKLAPGKGLGWGDYPDESIGDLANENGVDAAVVLVGG